MVNKLLTVLIVFFGLSNGNLLNKHLEEFNSPTHFVNTVKKVLEEKNNNISPQCGRHLNKFIDGLKSGKIWAIRMVDSWGKIPPGLLEGNFVDLGYFDECLKVEKRIVTSVTMSETMKGKYCIGTIPLQALPKYIPLQEQINSNILEIANPNTRMLTKKHEELGIHLATCLPDACSAADIEQIYAEHFKMGHMTFKEELCQTKGSQPDLDGGSIATLSFLGVVLGIMVLSTAYDIALYYLESKPAHSLLIAFSIFTNGKKLMTTNNGTSQINCLHGIRVISTMWVILGHRYSFQLSFPIRNSLSLLNFFNDQANMFLLGATVSVDTFFLLSGLVLVYVYMSAMEKGAKFNIILFYLHRYLRLTPVVAIVVVIHITLLRHLASGPLWPSTVQDILITPCEKYWWKALLYIQNYGEPEICVPQSWCLSVDTQLFLLSPILLIPLKFWPKFTLAATGFLAFCSVIAGFIITWIKELAFSIPASVDGDKMMEYMKYYYLSTWTRAAPWLMGFILGYIIFKVKQRKTKFVINKVVLLVLWVAAIALLCTCVFAGHDTFVGKYDKLKSSFYLALVRPSWAAAVGWVIFACVTGNGGPVDWFLSLPLFQVVSKVTFTQYMVHYVIVFMVPAQMRTNPMFDNPREMYVFWGDFVFTSVIALILTLAFESPMITIERFLFGGGKKKNVEPPQIGDNKTKSSVIP